MLIYIRWIKGVIDLEKRFKDFQNKRMEIFNKLIQVGWKKSLEIKDLEKVASEIVDKYGYQPEEVSFVKDHIRVAMGLDPINSDTFSNEIEKIKQKRSIKKPVITKIDGVCQHCGEELNACDIKDNCKYESRYYQKSTGPFIINDKCPSCGKCTVECTYGALADKIEFMPLLELLKEDDNEIYAAVAPSIVGQFGDNVSMGQLRTAFKIMGFTDMVEVALFADILTIKEAYEFDNLVKSEEDFFLTSCCCPIWINLVKRNYPAIFEKMSPSVSPMIASGRFLKKLYPKARVVFMSPCTAKKAEVKEDNIKDAIDFVLTFQELKEIFSALKIELSELQGEEKDQASFAGRVYARSGGVSLSVKTVVNRIAPQRLINLKSAKVAGIKECNKLLSDLKNNQPIEANFIEGMGCEGGCIGGPKTNLQVDEAKDHVNEFGEESIIMTPMDNLNIRKILSKIGLNEFKDIYMRDDIKRLLSRW